LRRPVLRCRPGAGGYTVNAAQQAQIKPGMSRDEVRLTLGRPAHNVKYRAEPGRTWTYGVLGSDEKVFDVDFSADGRVASTSQRTEVME
jgi:outer membrane protein assembly factor BamE (lipoprotein component of BamABCDE complex)